MRFDEGIHFVSHKLDFGLVPKIVGYVPVCELSPMSRAETTEDIGILLSSF